MNTTTIFNVLKTEGIDLHRVVQRFSSRGLEIAIRLDGGRRLVGLAPIHDASDVRFARWMAKQSKRPMSKLDAQFPSLEDRQMTQETSACRDLPSVKEPAILPKKESK